MIAPSYRAQVDLLLRVLPHVAKETCFALKGGTAINLFVRMPAVLWKLENIQRLIKENPIKHATHVKALDEVLRARE